MEYVLGWVCGMLTALLILAALAFLRHPVEQATTTAQRALEQASPQPKGAVFFPEDEASIERAEIVERNRRQGRDTPISELMSKE